MTGPIAKGTIRTTFVLGLRLIVQAGTLLIVARMLGPQQFGAFAGIAALAVILGTLSTFGTHLVLLGEVSKDPSRRAQVLSYAIPVTLLCGTTLLAIYLLVCTFALHKTGVSLRILLAIGITETLLQPMFGLMVSEHHALGRIARSQLMQLFPLVLRLTTAIVVFTAHPPDALATYAAGYITASVLALVFGTLKLPAPWPGFCHWRIPRQLELREAFSYAAINITKAGPAELDKTLATKLLPLATAGVYAAGARVIGAVTLPITAMTLSALPRLFREGQTHRQRTSRLLRWMFGSAAVYSLVLACVLWSVAPVFNWFFGAHYKGIDHIIRWLCVAVPGMALRLTAGNVLMALSKPWMRVGFEACGLLVLVIVSTILTTKLGTIGMPLALACSEWVMATLGLVMVATSLSGTSGPFSATHNQATN